ncbi:MAG TPA: DUF1176 domain-containing protein, partial [Phenylobacterium sp.]
MRWFGWLLLGVLGLAAGAARAETTTFTDWVAICDNVRTCSAYGFSSELSEDVGYVRLTRGAAANDAPKIWVSVTAETNGSWELAVDGKNIGGPLALRGEKDDAYRRAELSPVQASALLAGLANGSSLTLSQAGQAPRAISLKGSSAALRWIDDR